MRRCGCSHSCWCRRPMLSAFRRIMPIGHDRPTSSGRAAGQRGCAGNLVVPSDPFGWHSLRGVVPAHDRPPPRGGVGGPPAVGPAGTRVRSVAEVGTTRLGKRRLRRAEQARRAGQAVARDVRAGRPTRPTPVRPTRDNHRNPPRLPVDRLLPRVIKTASKIHLLVDLPPPSRTRRGSSVLLSCATPRPAAAQGSGPTRTISATPKTHAVVSAAYRSWWQPLGSGRGPEPVDIRTSATCSMCSGPVPAQGSVQVPGPSLSHRLPTIRRVALSWPARVGHC